MSDTIANAGDEAIIIDGCDNFYRIQDAITGEMFGGRFAFRNSAEETARRMGYTIRMTEGGSNAR